MKYVCTVCGYVHEGDEPPEVCPKCKQKDVFKKVEEEGAKSNPYAGTKTYTYANVSKMDYEHFWNWIREISKNNSVFVSEQTAPEDFEVIWQQKAIRTMNKENNF